MTRTEAIGLLSGLMFKGKLKEALDMAIKALEQEPTTKNDLGVDTDKLIADCEKMSFDFELFGRPTKALLLDAVKNIVKDLPSVTPQEPQAFKWCTDCREYDQEKHCCHRWSKVIRDTVEEMKQEQEPKVGHWIDREVYDADRWKCSECGRTEQRKENFCPNCGAKMDERQGDEMQNE